MSKKMLLVVGLLLLAAFALTACAGEAGPPGPEGPQGPQGEQGPEGGAAIKERVPEQGVRVHGSSRVPARPGRELAGHESASARRSNH